MSNFADDLAFADGHEHLLRLAYQGVFPECTFIAKNAGDNRAQRMGVDRILVRANGDPLTIDEKIRRIPWPQPPDLLLEYLSNVQTGAPGWMVKRHQIDYLACVYLPNRLLVLLGWPMLKKAWDTFGHRWVKQYRVVVGETDEDNGRSYTTHSVAVPERVLTEAGVNITHYIIPFPKVAGGGPPPLPAQPKSRQGNLFG